MQVGGSARLDGDWFFDSNTLPLYFVYWGFRARALFGRLVFSLSSSDFFFFYDQSDWPLLLNSGDDINSQRPTGD